MSRRDNIAVRDGKRIKRVSKKKIKHKEYTSLFGVDFSGNKYDPSKEEEPKQEDPKEEEPKQEEQGGQEGPSAQDMRDALNDLLNNNDDIDPDIDIGPTSGLGSRIEDVVDAIEDAPIIQTPTIKIPIIPFVDPIDNYLNKLSIQQVIVGGERGLSISELNRGIQIEMENGLSEEEAINMVIDNLQIDSKHYQKVETGTKRKNIKIGTRVLVVEKKNQKSNKMTEGIVVEILTKSDKHPHGIKVRLQNGKIGRVKIINASNATGKWEKIVDSMNMYQSPTGVIKHWNDLTNTEQQLADNDRWRSEAGLLGE